jgi:predicted alpha/beta superfamily hydrolase
MTTWQDYMANKSRRGHTVVGNVQMLKKLPSPQLGNQRDLVVYLPPSYEVSDRRYPVLYMHDGQNLFDRATSYAGEWQVDETMEALSQEGLEAIVVGVPNMGTERMVEYNPYDNPQEGPGRGDAYVAFLVETVKPLVDADFRTRPGPAHTGVMGSSMGGLISLYAGFRHPEVFGLVGAVSPAFGPGRAIYPFIEEAPARPGRIYMDVGTREGAGLEENVHLVGGFSRVYMALVRRMRDLLLRKGYRPGEDLLYVEERRAFHHESAWARRLPAALRFLLTNVVVWG